MNKRPITEDDLHAYVDQALSTARRDEVAGYLEQHPDEAKGSQVTEGSGMNCGPRSHQSAKNRYLRSSIWSVCLMVRVVPDSRFGARRPPLLYCLLLA